MAHRGCHAVVRLLLLLACIAGAYVAWPCAVLRPAKTTSILDILAHNERPLEVLQAIQEKAVAYCKSDKIAGRADFMSCLRGSFKRPGLSVVLGGKSVGKTKIIKQLVSEFRNDQDSPVLYVNMRIPGSGDVLARLEAEFLEQESGWLKMAFPTITEKLEKAMKPVSAMKFPDQFPMGGVVASTIALLRSAGALNPKQTIETLIKKASSEGKVPVFIIDEANLALPNGVGNGARNFMNFMVSITKEQGQAAVFLVSSEYGYPCRLNEVGLYIKDPLRLIVAPEVDRNTMIQVLREEWGMAKEMAEAFEEHFGGHLFLCDEAVTLLSDLFSIGQGDTFSPYGMLDNWALPELVRKSETRKHMENIADNGWSAINEANSEGAEEIARMSYGAVIAQKALTFDIPTKVKVEMFKGEVKQVLIPASRHMRACIQQDVEFWRAKQAVVQPWEQ